MSKLSHQKVFKQRAHGSRCSFRPDRYHSSAWRGSTHNEHNEDDGMMEVLFLLRLQHFLQVRFALKRSVYVTKYHSFLHSCFGGGEQEHDRKHMTLRFYLAHYAFGGCSGCRLPFRKGMYLCGRKQTFNIFLVRPEQKRFHSLVLTARRKLFHRQLNVRWKRLLCCEFFLCVSTNGQAKKLSKGSLTCTRRRILSRLITADNSCARFGWPNAGQCRVACTCKGAVNRA